MWEQRPTTGTPPLGVLNYAVAIIRNELFYFGGYCNHDNCYHNSLHSFDLDILKWKELSPTATHHTGPTMKSNSNMMALHTEGEDYLVVLGGYGPSFRNVQSGVKHDRSEIYGYCSELNYYKLSSGQYYICTIFMFTRMALFNILQYVIHVVCHRV